MKDNCLVDINPDEIMNNSLSHARKMVKLLEESASWIVHPANLEIVSEKDKQVKLKLLQEWRDEVKRLEKV